MAFAVLAGEMGSERVSDTEMRSRLLEGKRNYLAFSDYAPAESFVHSSLVYDMEAAGGELSFPWALPGPDPSGLRSISVRVKVPFRSAFSINSPSGKANHTVRLSRRDGSTVFFSSRLFTIPAEKVEIEPGIYLLEAQAKTPLASFKPVFAPLGPPAPETAQVKDLYLKLDNIASKDLERLVALARGSTNADTVKMPKGRVDAAVADEAGRAIAKARVGLSGRTRVHLSDFPSVDVKIKDGKSFMGITSFKLYRLDTKVGVKDLVFLSVLSDMGYFTPRQEVINLFVNGEKKGLYILMETFTPALFTARKRLEGAVVGVDSGKLFFDYPFGASIDPDYLYEIKDPQYEKKDARFFLSDDFTSMLDRHSTARFMAFTTIYCSAHGLGVDDLRWYEDPATNTFFPMPRDLDPWCWEDSEPIRPYLSQSSWWANSPMYTVWPVRKLLRSDYEFDRGKPLGTDDTSTVHSDVHFSAGSFISDPGNLGLVNGYISYFARDMALKEKIEARTGNLLEILLKEEPGNTLLSGQQTHLKSSGVSFMGSLAKSSQPDSLPTFTAGGKSYRWNMRTSIGLEKGLKPSFFAPMTHGMEAGEARAEYALAFMLEKKIFEEMKKAGLTGMPSTFAESRPSGADIAVAGPVAAKARPFEGAGNKNEERIVQDLVTYVGTHSIDGKASVLFLVRNAAREASRFRIVMKDGMWEIAPSVNVIFRIESGASAERSSVWHALANRFLRGEDLRLLAFEIPQTGRAQFYRLSAPKDSSIIFPPYMYVPAKASKPLRERGVPPEFVRSGDGFHLPAGSKSTLSGHVVFPEGAALHIHEGSTILLGPGVSIEVTGDLMISGTKEAPVRFRSTGVEPWGGLYAGGRRPEAIKVVMSHALFENYGSWPRTRIGGMRLNGGIAIYNAEAELDNVSFKDAKSEDALNLIGSSALMRGVEITGAHSDGIDLDFSYALIEGLRTDRTGGDGLDVSSSLVVCSESEMANAVDKGLSAGEMSRVFVKGSAFLNNDLGVANKDQSFVSITGSRFESNRIAVAEFIKKPYFGKPGSELKDNSYANNGEEYRWLGFFRY